MIPTTLKLPQALRARVAAVVDGTDKSMHAFMLEAIEQQTKLAERRKDFISDALDARDDLERTGVGYASADVHAHMDRRARGEKPERPKTDRWRK